MQGEITMEQALANLKNLLQSDNIDGYSLRNAYREVRYIIKEPQFSSELTELLKSALKLKENDCYSLRDAYDILKKAIQAHPQLASEVFEAFKIAVKSEKNNTESLKIANQTLAEIVKEQPQLSLEVIKIIKTEIEENKSAEDYAGALKILGEVAINQPDSKPLNCV